MASQRPEYDSPRAAHIAADFSETLDQATERLFHAARQVGRDPQRNGYTSLRFAVSALRNYAHNGTDTSLEYAAQSLARLGRELYDKQHPLVHLGARMLELLSEAENRELDQDYMRALLGQDSRGRPYGQRSLAVGLSLKAADRLAGLQQSIEALIEEKRVPPYSPPLERVA